MLGQPLDVLDFRENRWVAGHREEAFSDWLQWIVVLPQVESTEVLHIFGVTDADMISACTGRTRTTLREACVRQGHEGGEDSISK